jgi:hypothetical protein
MRQATQRPVSSIGTSLKSKQPKEGHDIQQVAIDLDDAQQRSSEQTLPPLIWVSR